MSFCFVILNFFFFFSHPLGQTGPFLSVSFLVGMITISWHHSPSASIFIVEFLHSQICVSMFEEAFIILQEFPLFKTFQSCFFFFLFHASIILESSFKDFLRDPWNYKSFPIFSLVFETWWLTLLCKFPVSVLSLWLWRLHFFRDYGTK